MFKAIFVIVSVLFLNACASYDVTFSNQRSQVWIVAADAIECHSVGTQSCLKIKRSSQLPWQLFYDDIEGFDPIDGIEYKIRVAVTPIENPIADASNQTYTLLDILETNKP